MPSEHLPDSAPTEPPQAPDPRRLRTTGPKVLTVLVLVGLVAGWAVRAVCVASGNPAPRVSWLQVAALYLVAAILLVLARATHRAVQQGHRRLRPHEAVNRLVLAKSCALVGALVAGAYLGYAFSWVGIDAELASERIVHSLAAAGGAVLSVVGSLLTERACRVRGDDEEP
jgi:O-antigen/teichoic acid export membrane protein